MTAAAVLVAAIGIASPLGLARMNRKRAKDLAGNFEANLARSFRHVNPKVKVTSDLPSVGLTPEHDHEVAVYFQEHGHSRVIGRFKVTRKIEVLEGMDDWSWNAVTCSMLDHIIFALNRRANHLLGASP